MGPLDVHIEFLLTLALVGGGSNGPPWFFANNSLKTRRVAGKLAVSSR